MQRLHSTKTIIRRNNFKYNSDEVEIREYAEERIVEHTQKNGKTQYVVRCYGYTIKDNTMEPLEHLVDQSIVRFVEALANGQKSQTRRLVNNDQSIVCNVLYRIEEPALKS